MKKNLNKQNNKAWREQIDTHVVDLRVLAKKNSSKQSPKRVQKKSVKKLTQKNQQVHGDMPIPQYFAALKNKKRPPRTHNRGLLLRQQLEAELSNIDSQDVLIQKKIHKSQESEDNSKKLTQSIKLADFDLIPRASSHLSIPVNKKEPHLPKPKQEKRTPHLFLVSPSASSGLRPSGMTKEREKVRGRQKNSRNKKNLRKQILTNNSNPGILSEPNNSLSSTTSLSADTHKKELRPAKSKRKTFVKKVSFAVLISLVLGVSFLALRAFSLKDDMQLSAEAAYEFMLKGQEALLELDAQEASRNFTKAQQEFSKIENNLGIFSINFTVLMAEFPIQNKLSSQARLLNAGKFFAEAGYEASTALGLLQGIDNFKASEENQNQFLTDNIIDASFALQRARELLRDANLELSYARPQDMTGRLKDDILLVQQETNKIESTLEEALSSLDVLLTFLGHNNTQNYLLLFQNSSELRAGGGFIGTFGLLELDKGNISDLFIDGIYNPDGQLQVKVIPPRPLQYVTPNWGTRDANWFFDFPTSAEKAMWFYTQTGGIETGGVIGITPRVVEKLLEFTGPIDMPEYNVVLDSDNFLELVQQEVEVDYDKELNHPKQILADLAPKLIEKLSLYENKIELFNLAIESLQRKDIQIYSRSGIVQKFALQNNWAGALTAPGADTTTLYDYLGVVISNIGGWKTDKYTKTEVDTVTTINDAGEVYRTVIISRKHEGGHTPYIWYNRPNYGYIRIYTPLGSEYVSAEGFSSAPRFIQTDYVKEGYVKDKDIVASEATLRHNGETGTDVFEETGRTVFGNWLLVPPGERNIVKLTYKLPFTVERDTTEYSLTIQKQSGLTPLYSGAIEDFNPQININNCSLNRELLSGTSFKFEQTGDMALECKIRR